MKVLFISSGKRGSVGEVVKNQGDSLAKEGIEVDYYIIKSGLWGYLSAIPNISRTFKKGNYNLAHAHYSFSGFAASLAGSSPLVVSLMGSDAYMSGFLRNAARLFYKYRWSSTIVKTRKMKELLRIDNAHVIPNGVDITKFRPIPKAESRIRIRFTMDKKLVVFLSDPKRPEKDFNLAQQSVRAMNDSNIELLPVFDVPSGEVPFYINAADVLLLTSKYEGSVNVIKEAMACNCPVVSTNVGDVKWVTGDTKDCFITSFEAEDIALKIKAALVPGRKTNGRQRIIELGLDSISVSNRIKVLYKDVISNQ
jgi:glycosyltransferase involved in cell wall biosynthesis